MGKSLTFEQIRETLLKIYNLTSDTVYTANKTIMDEPNRISICYPISYYPDPNSERHETLMISFNYDQQDAENIHKVTDDIEMNYSVLYHNKNYGNNIVFEYSEHGGNKSKNIADFNGIISNALYEITYCQARCIQSKEMHDFVDEIVKILEEAQ